MANSPTSSLWLLLQISVMWASPTASADRSLELMTTKASKLKLADCGICLPDLNRTYGKNSKDEGNDCHQLNDTAFRKRYPCTGDASWNFGACMNESTNKGIPVRLCCATTCCKLGLTSSMTCAQQSFGNAQSIGIISAQDNDWENPQFKIGLFWEEEVQLVLRLRRTVANESSIVCSCINRCDRNCITDPTKVLGVTAGVESYGATEVEKVLMAGKMYNAAYIKVNDLPPRGSYKAEATYWSAKKGNFHVAPLSVSERTVPDEVPFIALMKIDKRVVTSRKSVKWQKDVKLTDAFDHLAENSKNLFQFDVAGGGQVSLH